MINRTGPMIEGVVSPTASAETRRKALASAATPDRFGAQQYEGTQRAFNQGANTATAAGAGLLEAAMDSGQRSRMDPGVLDAAKATAGFTVNADGTLRSIYSGQNYGSIGELMGTTTLSGSPNTGGGYVPPGGPGGAGGGGGGGGEVGPSDPGGGPGGGPGGPDTLGGASAAAIEAQINALTSQYGLDLEGIAALGGEIGAQARFLMAQLQRDQGFAQEDLLGNLVGRGVFRSGITARDTGRLQGDFAARRAQVEMNKGQQLRQLAERAGIAKAGLARGKADVISQIDNANLPAELRQVMLNELNSLTPDQIQAALDASRRPQGQLDLTDEDLRNRQTVGASGVNLGGF